MVISLTIKSGVALMPDARKCVMTILNALGMSGLVKNLLNLGVILSTRWSTVSQSVPVNAEDPSKEHVTLHGNKTELIPMTYTYESLVNEECSYELAMNFSKSSHFTYSIVQTKHFLSMNYK